MFSLFEVKFVSKISIRFIFLNNEIFLVKKYNPLYVNLAFDKSRYTIFEQIPLRVNNLFSCFSKSALKGKMSFKQIKFGSKKLL